MYDYADIDIEIADAWKEFLRALYPYLKITGEICAKSIAKTIMLKIGVYVKEENIFTQSDEKLFVYFDEIMRKYAGTIEIYKKHLSGINDVRVNEILGGVCDILSSQLRQYEEHIGRAAGSLGKAFKNPIGAEKERVLAHVYEGVSGALSAVNANICSKGVYFEQNELEAFCFDCAGKSVNESHIDCFEFLYQRILEKGGLDIYKCYSGALTECAADINSLALRKETHYFYEALKQEKEMLGSIVKIQISALAESGGDEREKRLIESITSSITEIYSFLEQKEEELSVVFREAEGSVKRPALMDYDGFLSFVEEYGLCACTDKYRSEGLESGTLTAVQLWKKKLDLFIQSFERFTVGLKMEFDAKPYKMFVYEMRKKIADKLLFTDEMLKAFRELAGFYEHNRNKFSAEIPEEYMRIIDGINESITIKIDILEDARKSFAEESEEKLGSYSPPEFTENDGRELMGRRISLWGAEMFKLDAYSPAYDEEAQAAIRTLTVKLEKMSCADEYTAKSERKMQKEADEIIKLETAYLKNSALFEIVTFEEILAYSVSKLRECEKCSEYAAACDALDEILSKLCKLHNIIVIAPEPFDFFNSQEHEVLVAEKSEGYKKGQIIKKMNSGFKYNEAVLMRANVIAAK